MKKRTSETHPLRLDCLPSGLLPTPGRLGLTFAPGKKGPGLEGAWRRDLRLDLTRLRDVYGVGAIISLLEDHELRTLGIEHYREDLRSFRSFELRALPIPDGGVPQDLDAVRSLVGWILERLGDGTHVAVHCRGGLGRSGLVAACCLFGVGVGPEVAIREVRVARPGALETAAQEAFVGEFARRGMARRGSWKTTDFIELKKLPPKEAA
jgi:protein-tyrosine phosphatase